MNILICDDDKNDLDIIKNLVAEYDQKNGINAKIYCYSDGIGILDAVFHNLPDIIFLDINMVDMDGLTVARKIREKYDDIPIVLVTAYMNYALDGYKVRASRFLIKDDLENTFDECMDDICREIKRKSKTICLLCVEGEIYFKTEEIILIETERHRCAIRLKERLYHICEKIDNLEERLKDFGFLRIHQSYLVNMRYIRSINSYLLTMADGSEFSVPKARYKQVKRQYTLYMGKTV